jgi:arginine/serine-rich splicing factor 7
MGRSRDREGSLSSTGSGRTVRSKKWDGETGSRIHLSDLPVGVSKHEIEKLFRPYGQLNEIWVASNPPCFAFINFRHRSDGERAIKELDGTILAGQRIGMSWARPRHYGGRSRHRSPSPSNRRSYRDSYDNRRRRHSRSRSRSPRHQRSSGSYRRRTPSSRSPPPPKRREERQKPSKREEHRHRRHSSSGSAHSPRRDNGKQPSHSPSNERQRLATPNGDNIDDNNHAEIEVDAQD